MFKKKPTVKPLAPLRSSDRRKLAQQTISDLSVPVSTSDEDKSNSEAAVRNSLFPENTRSAKFNTTAGPNLDTVHGNLYVTEDGRPIWVKFDDGMIFPTVYTLWNNPRLLPVVHTHGPVIEKLCAGADLMTPGIIGPPFPQGATKDRLVAVASIDSPEVALAVGICSIDIANLQKAVGEKGKAVEILHFVGDEIFKQAGALAVVPESLEITQVTKALEKVDVGEEEPPAPTNPEPVDDDVRELDTKEIDKAFHDAVLYGLLDLSTNDNLSSISFPLSSSAFISTFVHPYLAPPSHFPPHNLEQTSGPHPSLQLKKSSSKNASKFLKQLEKEKLIKTKTRTGGETVVLAVDPTSEAVQKFRRYRLPSAPKEVSAGDSANAPASGGIQVNALYRPNGKALKFFEAINASTKDFYTATQLKTMLNSYIDAERLPNPANRRLVKLDPLLSNTLFKSTSEPGYKPLLPREALLERLYAGCAPFHTITSPTTTTAKPKPGAAPHISVVIEKRQGNKTVTRIFNLEPFGVDPKALAEELQRICAGSATVGQAVGLKPGLLEVLVQGTQTTAVAKVLEKKGLPKKLLTVLDKTHKSGK